MKRHSLDIVWTMTRCIIPRLSPTVYGYSQVHINGKTKRAHRVVYENIYGPIPLGLLVMHKCDNRRCINPLHLRLGTAKDNTLDSIAKGRFGIRDQRRGRAATIGRALPKGVCFDNSRYRWSASIRVGSRRYSKKFKAGDLLNAVAWRKSMEKEVW